MELALDFPWTRLSEIIAETMGLDFPPQRCADLRRGITAAAAGMGFADVAACVDWLLSSRLSREDIRLLARYLTVGETYFCRDKRTFDVMTFHALPALIEARRNRRRLRIWSAACCTGQEPYSVAILLHQLMPDLAEWDITILGTDINPAFLEKAAIGHYGEWSFRETPDWFKARYFKAIDGGQWSILPEIKRMVTFSPLNLVEDVYPSHANNTSEMDLILCRNVLMYFTIPQARKVIRNLRSSLVEDGWLAAGPSEGSQIMLNQFAPVNFPGVILYKRTTEGMGTGPRSPALEPVCASTPVFEEPYVEIKPDPFEFLDAPLDEALTPPEPNNVPVDTPSYQEETRSLANEGNLPAALAHCDKWIAVEKLNPAAHYLRAMILQELGDIGSSRQSLQRAIYLEPDLILAHYALANLARSANRTAEAEKHFSNALDLLRRRQPGDILPESDGVTAARLEEIIRSTQ